MLWPGRYSDHFWKETEGAFLLSSTLKKDCLSYLSFSCVLLYLEAVEPQSLIDDSSFQKFWELPVSILIFFHVF